MSAFSAASLFAAAMFLTFVYFAFAISFLSSGVLFNSSLVHASEASPSSFVTNALNLSTAAFTVLSSNAAAEEFTLFIAFSIATNSA